MNKNRNKGTHDAAKLKLTGNPLKPTNESVKPEATAG